MTDIQKRLLALQDESYRDFQRKLIPNVCPSAIIGVRIPTLRKLAKELAGTSSANTFLSLLPHTYYEENLLHAFLLEQIKNFDICVSALDVFLPFVDNWSVCDSMNPKILGKHKAKLLPVIKSWLTSSHVYAVRFGIKLMMAYFLDADFSPAYLSTVAAIRSDEYYVNMMIAWYFATALAKQPDETLPYLMQHRLSPWIHRKTVRKAIESYRISDEMKALLRKI